MFIDSHAHIMFPDFNDDKDKVIARSHEAGVEKIINVGCSLDSSNKALKMIDSKNGIYATLGLHPYDAADVNEGLMDKWKDEILKNKMIVAVGECGLDYFKSKVPHDVQKMAFIRQIELAKECNVPLIIHNRDADEDSLSILSEHAKGVKIVFHCYGSNLDFAWKVWNKGWFTSFTGIITYPNAHELRKVVKEVPSDLFMIETDCPYLAPQSHRGERNEPSYVVEVARKIAEIKGLSLEEIETQSTDNTLWFFERMKK
ncbi:YchF/TatD family DNA exonuclease [Candidatus Peregrinibacteria bacterium]|nr:YchF/TatD family DNA exonuclease [Candidatus Peregrinibacteria bacterium]